MGRAVGLDLGDRRIGVALSDERGRVATPFEVVARVGDQSVEHDRILEIVEEAGADTIVVGLPLHLDGSESETSRRYRAESRGLVKRARRAELDIRVVHRDERLSTVSAHRQLDEAGVARRKQRRMVDAVAAAVMLQAWLDDTVR